MQQTRREFLGSLAATSLLASAGSPLSAAETAPSDELAVMTYNLRYASPSGPNSWPSRRPLVKAVVDGAAPDLIGTQEGVYGQLREFAADQPAFDWIGLGRDGGSRGEFMALFYRRERLEPLEFDHFWLSDTPEVIASATWGNSNRRMVTWARFRDRRTGREFYAWNTHFDHQVRLAREKSAELIRQRLEKTRPELPLLLLGDFNARAGATRAYDQLLDGTGLSDTWTLAGERRHGEFDTFNNFTKASRDGERIDWILGRGLARVRASEILVGNAEPPFPSDHFPVMAWLTLK